MAIGVAAALVAGVGWYEISSHPFGGPGKPVTVQVTTGESYSSAVSALSAAGVLSDSTAFRIYSVIHGSPTISPGYYTLPKNSTFGAVHEALSAGPNTFALHVPPGFTLAEVTNRLHANVGANYADKFAALLKSGKVRSSFEPTSSTNLEGLVSPGIYLVTPTTSATALLTSMVADFEALARSVGLTPATVARGHDAYSLITQASIVEKEGYYAPNMPKVARVIDNRLAQGMPLQMDATVLYALGQDGGPVTSATERTVSPYNTYLNRGLPPTPICTPSKAALAAVMNPPAGAWLFFTVIDRSGTEAFSDTFKEQLANEALAASRGL